MTESSLGPAAGPAPDASSKRPPDDVPDTSSTRSPDNVPGVSTGSTPEALPKPPETTRPVGPRTFVHGGLMGLTDAVPGVSGGTVALILGIHPRLVNSIACLRFGLLRFLWEARHPQHRPAARAAAAKADLTFLAVLASGLVLGLFGGAKVMISLLERYPQAMAAAFLALVMMGVQIPLHKADKSWRGWLVAVPAALAALAITLAPSVTEPLLWALPFYGALAASAMILPGISGSYVLLILGAYPLVLGGLADFDLVIIVLTGTGAVAGLLMFTKGLRWLLEKREGATHAAMVGLLLGSLGRLWPWRTETGFAAGLPAVPDATGWVGVAVGAGIGIFVGWLFTALAESE